MAAGAVSCQLTPDSVVISLSWWMTEMPLAPLFATTKMHPCLPPPPIWLSPLHCFSPHFHQLPQNSTHHIGSAADAESKNETCVARHRCTTLYFLRARVHLSFNLALILSLGDSKRQKSFNSPSCGFLWEYKDALNWDKNLHYLNNILLISCPIYNWSVSSTSKKG